ncbi:MAG TPA: hypothetical protein VFZ61_11685 [Polyangiales bacterium]
MRRPWLPLLLLALLAGVPSGSAQAPAPPGAAATAPALVLTPITRAELPPQLRPLPELVRAVRWSDGAGDNVAAFSRARDEKRGDARLKIELWSGKAGSGRVLRTLKDAELGCEFDLYADFVDAALGLTDVDGDGIGELTFAYRTTCTSDVSPFALKLFLLEQGAKYALRGSTQVDTGGGELVGGAKRADPALAKVPAFSLQLDQIWARIVALNPWT